MSRTSPPLRENFHRAQAKQQAQAKTRTAGGANQ